MRPNIMLAEEREQLRAAEAVVDAAIWCQSVSGDVALSHAQRELLIQVIKANPQMTGELFLKGLMNLS